MGDLSSEQKAALTQVRTCPIIIVLKCTELLRTGYVTTPIVTLYIVIY